MSRISRKIDSYIIHIASPNWVVQFKKRIILDGDFGRAYINFIPDTDTLLDNTRKGNIFAVYYWEKEWDSCMDVLRNESPVYFYYNDNNVAWIYTGEEPVGESEFNTEFENADLLKEVS